MTLVRKSEFAKLCNVSNGRISQWITAGHISGDAIVGEGQRAMLDVDLAREQLKERLDTDQRYGINGLDTNLEPSAPVVPVVAGLRQVETIETDGTVEARLKAEKLKQAEFLTNRLKAEDRARHGKYMDAMEAAAGMTRVADEMLKIFEGVALGAISSARMREARGYAIATRERVWFCP